MLRCVTEKIETIKSKSSVIGKQWGEEGAASFFIMIIRSEKESTINSLYTVPSSAIFKAMLRPVLLQWRIAP